jgi:hypothetical protein
MLEVAFLGVDDGSSESVAEDRSGDAVHLRGSRGVHFLVVRIASMARTILVSWVCTSIALLLCRGAIEFGGRDAVEKVAGRL